MTRSGKTQARAGGAKPKAEVDEFLFLPDRPLNPVAHQRSRDTHEVQTAIVSEAKRLGIEAAARIIERDFLGVLSGEELLDPAGEVERTAAIIERHVFPMPRHRDIGQMPVEREGGQHLHAVDGRALRLMDGRGVAVIEVSVDALVNGDLGSRRRRCKISWTRKATLQPMRRMTICWSKAMREHGD